MNRLRRNGFALFLVVLILALVGAAMIVLAGGSHSMVFESNRISYEACKRNLEASALAWVHRKAAEAGGKAPAESGKLDVTEWDIPSAELEVRIVKSDGRTTEVQITTSCPRGARTITRSRGYTLRQ